MGVFRASPAERCDANHVTAYIMSTCPQYKQVSVGEFAIAAADILTLVTTIQRSKVLFDRRSAPIGVLIIHRQSNCLDLDVAP